MDIQPKPRLDASASPTTSELQGIARFRFHDGMVDEFKRLSAQCIEIVRTKDSGTLQYEIHFNADETECIVLERYRDSEALVDHMTNLGTIGEAILATGIVTGELLGNPSIELRTALQGSPVQMFTPFLVM